MNPLKHIFVMIIFLTAGLQVEATFGVGGEAAGQNRGEIHDKISGKHTGGREIVTQYPELKGFFNEE